MRTSTWLQLVLVPVLFLFSGCIWLIDVGPVQRPAPDKQELIGTWHVFKDRTQTGQDPGPSERTLYSKLTINQHNQHFTGEMLVVNGHTTLRILIKSIDYRKDGHLTLELKSTARPLSGNPEPEKTLTGPITGQARTRKDSELKWLKLKLPGKIRDSDASLNISSLEFIPDEQLSQEQQRRVGAFKREHE